MNPLRRHRAPSAGERLAPFRIVIAYTLLGTLLVFFNDPALHALGLDDEAHGPLRIAGAG